LVKEMEKKDVELVVKQEKNTKDVLKDV